MAQATIKTIGYGKIGEQGLAIVESAIRIGVVKCIDVTWNNLQIFTGALGHHRKRNKERVEEFHQNGSARYAIAMRFARV